MLSEWHRKKELVYKNKHVIVPVIPIASVHLPLQQNVLLLRPLTPFKDLINLQPAEF